MRNLRVLIFGGTGSLGTTLTRRLLAKGIIVGIFSRDEAKNFYHKQTYAKHQKQLRYFIGDVRKYSTVYDTIVSFKPDVIIHAAAMKQVPLCEEFPAEAVATNVLGTQNIMGAAAAFSRTCSSQGTAVPVRILSISTDKAVKPVNAYGCTKQLQERITLRANDPNLLVANCVRYGNVLESTGSVIPVFKKQLDEGSQVTVTHGGMTRFLLSLDEAVDLIFRALQDTNGGNIFVPKLKSAYIAELAALMCEDRGFDSREKISVVGERPGEKIDEILISEEECHRVVEDEDVIIITGRPFISEGLHERHFSSGDGANVLKGQRLKDFLKEKGVLTCSSASQVQTAS